MNDELEKEDGETQAPSKGPDINSVDASDWPQADFPINDVERSSSVRVILKQSVLNAIHRHGQSRTDVEVCGVMIGNGYRDDHGPFVYVENIIQGQHSDSQTAQVTFTAETWNHIHHELDRDFPDSRILGWYHTHPGFGIFLSAMDMFIHENYFCGDEQLAFVYDPLGVDEGLFVWRSGGAEREEFLVDTDEEEDPKMPKSASRAEERKTEKASESNSGELLLRIQRIERRQCLGSAVMLLMAFVVFGWLLTNLIFMYGPKLIPFPQNNNRTMTPPARRLEPNPTENREENLENRESLAEVKESTETDESGDAKDASEAEHPSEVKETNDPQETDANETEAPEAIKSDS